VRVVHGAKLLRIGALRTGNVPNSDFNLALDDFVKRTIFARPVLQAPYDYNQA
jgi:hypothetical protein